MLCRISLYQICLSAECTDSEKIQEVITSQRIQAPSPQASLLDEIALALDGTSQVLSNWYTLAMKLGVPRKTCWKFERRSTENPTNRLFQYLAATCPQMTLTSLKEALGSIERKDLINILQEQNLEGNLSQQEFHIHVTI